MNALQTIQTNSYDWANQPRQTMNAFIGEMNKRVVQELLCGCVSGKSRQCGVWEGWGGVEVTVLVQLLGKGTGERSSDFRII